MGAFNCLCPATRKGEVQLIMKTIMCIVVLAAVASSLPAGTFIPNEEELLEVANNLPSKDEANHDEDPKADALMEAKDPEFDFLQNMMEKPEETEFVQGFNKEFFREDGVKEQHLSNYDGARRKRSRGLGLPNDFAESNNALSSTATLVSYSNAKRLARGKAPTRYLNGGFRRKSHYSAELSRKYNRSKGIIDPGFRNGPRNKEMNGVLRGIESGEARKKAQKLEDKLYDRHLEAYKADVGQGGWGQ